MHYQAHLVSIHSEEEHQFVVGLDGSAGWAWLGGRRDPGNDSNWVWSDGTPWDYRNWALGEPNNPGKQDCSRTWVFGHLSSEQSKWDDYYCNNMQTFVCKKGRKNLDTEKVLNFRTPYDFKSKSLL